MSPSRSLLQVRLGHEGTDAFQAIVLQWTLNHSPQDGSTMGRYAAPAMYKDLIVTLNCLRIFFRASASPELGPLRGAESWPRHSP